jgi:hypothetical protein
MIIGIIDWLGTLGGSLALLLLEGTVLFGAMFIGVAVAARRNSTWQGWASGLISLVLLGAIFMPSIEALRESLCKGAQDFQACMEGEGE